MFELFESTRATVLPLFQVIRDDFVIVYRWFNLFLNSLYRVDGFLHPLYYLFLIPIGIFLVFLSIKVIRFIVWGN